MVEIFVKFRRREKIWLCSSHLENRRSDSSVIIYI